MRFVLASFAALALAAFAQPSVRDVPSFNPSIEVVKALAESKAASAPAPVPEAITNAKRFAQHLPPLRPKAHRRIANRRGPVGGTRARSAPRAETSPLPPIMQSCNIKVTNDNGTDLGFIAPAWNSFGEYSDLQSSQDGALLVSFSYPSDAPSQISLTAVNGPEKEAYPFFGGIVGFASQDEGDFGPGSYNYAYLGGTTATTPGSPAVAGANSFSSKTDIDESIESAIWTYDSATGDITPQWINSDGSAPATVIVYPQGVFAITGDAGFLAETFGPTDVLHFKCVPPVAQPAKF